MIRVVVEITKPIEWYDEVAASHNLRDALQLIVWLEKATGWLWRVE